MKKIKCIAMLGLIFLMGSCSGKGPVNAVTPQLPPVPPAPLMLDCFLPYRASLNNWFTLPVVVTVNDAKVPHPESIHVKTDSSDSISYRPAEFDVNVGKPEFIKVKVSKSESGIAAIILYATEVNNVGCNYVLDVGFQGHLKLSGTPTLSYSEPTALTLAIVDANDKPLPLDAQLYVQLQAANAQLSDGVTLDPNSKELHWSENLVLPVKPGSRSTPQFRIRATNTRGGTVNLATSFSISPDSWAVLAQENFSFSANPAWWLPIVLAIAGSMLYGAYSFVQAPKAGWRNISLHFAASIIGGIIAYLFAGFDLLGLKLDPNVLKTYPLLGFIFSYAGIEILLSKRFKSQESDQEPDRSADKEHAVGTAAAK